MHLKFYFFILILTGFSASSQNIKTELGANWQFRKVGDAQWMSATVPGTVHNDLLSNKKIPDPFYRDNELKLQWIENENWEYQADFDLDQKIILKQNIDLVFNGLDTYAEVYLNDALILQADNMFRRWKIEVKNLLKERNNRLQIKFASAKNKAEALAKASFLFELPGHARVYARKAQYHFGWNGGPKMMTSGIWRKVEIEAWDEVKVEDVFVRDFIIDTMYRDNKLVTFAQVETEITINSRTDKIYNLALSEFIPAVSGNRRSTNAEYSRSGNFVELLERVYIKKGRNRYSVVFGIRNPELWWSVGLGGQRMYKLACDLYDASDVHAAAKEHFVTPFALRKIELVTDSDAKSEFVNETALQHNPGANTFYFKINGVDVFIKGTTYIPQSPFLPPVGEPAYRQVIENAKAANMNMLRVWGGGVYEDDAFYQLCDENGILVWQDLMFAAAMYPGHEPFIENVRAELEENIVRLRNHPSIALWYGNNENDEVWHNGEWQTPSSILPKDSVMISKWNIDLFHKLAPTVIKDMDGSRAYWPSSSSGNSPRNANMHAHPIDVLHVSTNRVNMQRGGEKMDRMASENGMRSLPAWSTIESLTKPEDRDTSTAVMKLYQKNSPDFEELGLFIDSFFHKPKDFESFAYLTQCLQAYLLKYNVEAQRSNMPFCMGTLYGQLNDSWPAASWGTIDAGGFWKAAHYILRHVYANQFFGISQNENKFTIHVVNDSRDASPRFMKASLMNVDGKLFWEKSFDLKKIIWGRQDLLTIDSVDLFKGINPANAVMQFSVRDSTGEFSTSNFIYFGKPKDQQLEKPRFSVRQPDPSHLEITSDILVRYVWVQVPGSAHLDQNFFDLLPGETMRIEIKSAKPIKNLLKQVKIRSLVDSYNPVEEIPVQ